MNKTAQFDLAKTVFNLLILGMLILFAFLIVKPFILSALWALLVVIATWPCLIFLQSVLWNKRLLATCVLIALIILVFTVPFMIGINHIVSNSDGVTTWIKTLPDTKPPKLEWLNSIPMVGTELYTGWQNLLSNSGAELFAKIQPYLGLSTSWLIGKLSGIGVLIVQCLLMILFCAIFYLRGEILAKTVIRIANRIANQRGENAVMIATHAIRAIALGVIVTALLQSILAGMSLYIISMPYFMVLTVLVFICCVAQVGPLVVLIPSIIWLFWTGNNYAGIFLVVMAGILSTIDNIVRPILIKKGADIPLSLVFLGVFGGMFAFGLIGLFVGPVVIAVSYRLLLAWTNDTELTIDSHHAIDAKTEPSPLESSK